jgi:hypothetical protein
MRLLVLSTWLVLIARPGESQVAPSYPRCTAATREQFAHADSLLTLSYREWHHYDYRPRTVVPSLRIAIDRAPLSLDQWAFVTQVLSTTNSIDSTVALAQYAVTRWPTCADARVALIRLSREQARFAGIREVRRLIADFPNDPLAWGVAAQTMVAFGLADEAGTMFRRAIELDSLVLKHYPGIRHTYDSLRQARGGLPVRE